MCVVCRAVMHHAGTIKPVAHSKQGQRVTAVLDNLPLRAASLIAMRSHVTGLTAARENIRLRDCEVHCMPQHTQDQNRGCESHPSREGRPLLKIEVRSHQNTSKYI